MTIDLAHLDHATAGDAALCRELLLLFRDQLADALVVVTPEASATDEAFAALLHRLRGGAETVGAKRLARDLAAAEGSLGRDPSDEPRSGVAKAVRRSLWQTLEAVQDLIDARDCRGLAKDGESG